MKNKGGISAFQDGWNYIMLWEEDGELHYPNDPNHWKKAILSREGKNTYVIINLIGCAYIIILLLMFSYEHIASFWFYVGLLPPSIYFYRRFKRDLLIQGYLDGYVDGYADGHRESNEKHNQLNNRY